MKSYLKTTFFLLFAALFVFSCEGSYDSLVGQRLENNPAPDSASGEAGNADFSNYVAIGNSLTAGFMDAALYTDGQEHSMAALIAEQLEYAGAPETFNQPDINSELGFNTSIEPNPQNLGRFKLNTDTSVAPIGPLPTSGGDPIGDYSGNASDLNNFGVPGIIVGQLLTPATGGPQSNPAFNRFYNRFASQPGSSTILSDAISAQPSFFTLWIGNNDILGYALSGASDQSLLTTVGEFEVQYLTGDPNQNITSVTDQLLNNTNANGVLINIPNVLAIPFFQAVQWNVVSFDTSDPEDDQTVTNLNNSFSQYNQALDQFASQGAITQAEANRRKVSYADGSNPVLINDETLTNLCDFDPNIAPYCIARPATENDLLLLNASSIIGTLANPADPQTVRGVAVPLEDQFVLIPSEQTEILSQITLFNGIIENAANSSERLALYDTRASDSAFSDLFGISDGQPGIRVNGTILAPDFSPNGVFSTDGIHPNPRGNAIVANEIISVIENNFGASIPKVNVLNQPSVQLCSGDCVSQQQPKQVIGNINYDISITR
jgi:hypothetical protein